MTDKPERTWLHKLVGRDPGHLPAWLLSSKAHSPNDVAHWGALIAAIIPGFAIGLLGLLNPAFVVLGCGVGAIGALVAVRLVDQAKRVERKARAQIRRGEP